MTVAAVILLFYLVSARRSQPACVIFKHNFLLNGELLTWDIHAGAKEKFRIIIPHVTALKCNVISAIRNG